MVTTFARTVKMNFIRLAVLIAVLFSLLAVSAPAPAAAAGCYDSASTYTRSFTVGWTGWYSRTATSHCADLNVAITDHPCWVYVDAMYYNPSLGRYVDGAYDDRWIPAGQWYAPIRNVSDGTNMIVRFYTQCSDSSATLLLAA